jgi:hypothetical protein
LQGGEILQIEIAVVVGVEHAPLIVVGNAAGACERVHQRRQVQQVCATITIVVCTLALIRNVVLIAVRGCLITDIAGVSDIVAVAISKHTRHAALPVARLRAVARITVVAVGLALAPRTALRSAARDLAHDDAPVLIPTTEDVSVAVDICGGAVTFRSLPDAGKPKVNVTLVYHAIPVQVAVAFTRHTDRDETEASLSWWTGWVTMADYASEQR